MKIMLACHRLPFPPKRGGKIRPFNIIRHLTESGHTVTVASLARSEEELLEGQGLREHCHKLLVGQVGKKGALAQTIARLPTRSPSSMGYFYSRSLHLDVSEELRQGCFDLVLVHCSSAAQYIRAVRGVPSILDFGDMDSQKWLDYSAFRRFPLSLGYWLEGTKLLNEEKRLARQFDLCTCTTRAELQTLNDLGVARQSGWFPNGVDPEFFAPTNEPYDPDQICFIGRMDYYPNQQAMIFFCNEVLPSIQAQRPATRLIVVGAEPSSEIRALGRLPGVTVTGTVADVRPPVRASALSVAPLLIARGTQNKILESMAMGVPVVCSDSAAQGVDAVPGEHLLTAGSRDAWVERIMGVLNHSTERQRLAESGRNRVLTHHSWAASMQKLDGIIGSLMEALRVTKQADLATTNNVGG